MVVRLKEWLIGIALILYALWNGYTVISGVVMYTQMFISPDFDIQYFMQTMYLYIGSCISLILLLISAGRCIIACKRLMTRHYIVISGVLGILAYAISSITFSAYNGVFVIPQFMLIPLVIVIIGIWRGKDGQYTTLLARHKQLD